MKVYIDFFGRSIPCYGLMISSGVFLGNLFMWFSIRKKGQSMTEMILLEAYALLGAIVGSKLLYFLTAWKSIEWSCFLEWKYFLYLMQAGFVFYGALLGGGLAFYAAGRFHKIPAMDYLRSHIAAIPFMHGIGRIGCFLAGCCYGIPWKGRLAVVFPEHSFAPSGIPLFPVQLVESVFLLLISGSIFLICRWRPKTDGVGLYLIFYSILRFILEFFRGDTIRGSLWGVSTSQWLSIPMLLLGLWLLFRSQRSFQSAL